MYLHILASQQAFVRCAADLEVMSRCTAMDRHLQVMLSIWELSASGIICWQNGSYFV